MHSTAEKGESKRCFILALGEKFNREKFITEKFSAALKSARDNLKVPSMPKLTSNNFMEYYEKFMSS